MLINAFGSDISRKWQLYTRRLVVTRVCIDYKFVENILHSTPQPAGVGPENIYRGEHLGSIPTEIQYKKKKVLMHILQMRAYTDWAIGTILVFIQTYILNIIYSILCLYCSAYILAHGVPSYLLEGDD